MSSLSNLELNIVQFMKLNNRKLWGFVLGYITSGTYKDERCRGRLVVIFTRKANCG